MINGYGAPIVRVYNTNEDLVFEGVTRFKYVRSEVADDASYITLETDDVNLCDHPDLQEHKKIFLVFGYAGSELVKHSVYIWDVKASFSAEGIRLELECYCKAAYMKLNSAKDVYEGKDTKEILGDMAQAYGLDYQPDYDENIPTAETYGGPEQSKLYIQDEAQPDGYTMARDNTSYVLNKPYDFKKWQAYAQANKSDKKAADELIKMEPIDNLFIDGTDDSLLIRRRNFLQKPKLSFHFRGEPGHLLEFIPASKNASKAKNAIANTVAGWVEEDKEYMQAQINRSHSGAGVLGDAVQLSLEQNIQDQVVASEGNKLDRPISIDGMMQDEYEGEGADGNPIYRRVFKQELDTTKQAYVLFKKRGTQPSKLVLDNKHAFYSAAIDNTGRIETRGEVIIDPKEYIPATHTNEKDMAGEGVNRQSTQELELNESQATVVGNPLLSCSMIITISGVGLKYSGNYYVVSVEHEISREVGYKCFLTLYRTSFNKIGTDNLRADPTDYGLVINTSEVEEQGENLNQGKPYKVVKDD